MEGTCALPLLVEDTISWFDFKFVYSSCTLSRLLGDVSRYIRRYARLTTSSFTITAMATWNAYTFLGRPLPGFKPDAGKYVVIQYVRKGQWETTRGKGYDWGTVQSSDVRGRFMRWDGYEGTSYIRREGTSGDEKGTRRVSVRGHGDTSRWRQENMPCTGHEDIA